MKKSTTVWLLKNVKKRIPALLTMSVAHVGHALFGVFFALGTRQVINAAVSGSRDAFLRACCIQGSIIAGLLLSQLLYRHLHARLEEDLNKDWKKRILHSLLRADYPSVSAYHSGELINRLNNDVRTVDEGLLDVLPSFAAMVTRVAGAVIVLTSLTPLLTMALLGVGLVLVVLTAFSRNRLKGLNKRVSETDGQVSALLQETLEKLLLVQAMDLSEEMEHRTDKRLDVRFEAHRKRKNMYLFANTCISVMYYLAGFCTLAWCAAGLLQGKMSFGDLTAVTQLVNQIQAPFVNLSSVIPKYTAMLASAERLMELTALDENRDNDTMLSRDAYEDLEAISAENLTFSYDRDVILSKLSFRLEKGCFAVVTGPSGKGKSTLLKLILGIFHPNDGQLHLDFGEQKLPLTRETRKLFAYVPQGNLIFSGTLRENLLIVDPNADEEAIRQATYVSAMDDYLPQLPDGLETELGESGAGLSEGQSQRLAIARAVLGGAPILLLDEATSALDEDTEKRVLERIRALPGRTCIVVTHRPAAREMADAQLDMA